MRGRLGSVRGVAQEAGSRWGAPPMYVGPPDPVSNLRPVVFGGNDDVRTQRQASSVPHPYSLSEFGVSRGGRAEHGGMLVQYAHNLGTRLEALQLQARLQSMWLDQFNQRFWTDNNLRFQRALDQFETRAGFAAGEAPLDTVSPFYRAWLTANATRLRNYNRTLWLSTVRVVMAQSHYALARRYTRLVAYLAGLR